MARKSRKNGDILVSAASTVATSETAASAAKVYSVAGYVRLSKEDKKQRGDSIETQQAIISAYVEENPDMELAGFYIDNGITGQILERPEFQRMLADMERGVIDCCVCKDLSRLGRNAIDTGYYVEKHFPTNNIRCIAINDDYDSNDPNSGGIMVSLKNMINEAYALEIGRKIRQTKQMQIKNGNFVGAVAPYGYLKCKSHKHKLVMDDYAAGIVRKVFEMAAQGKGITEISGWLLENDVLPPKRYLHSIGQMYKPKEGKEQFWNKNVIISMLSNRVYVGDMVQGKSKCYSYSYTKVPACDWVIVENTHEPIISRELFDTVQSIRQSKSGRVTFENRKVYDENIFLRKIFCGHCGYILARTKTGKAVYKFYCQANHRTVKGACVSVRVKESAVREAVFAELKKHGDEHGMGFDFASSLKTSTPSSKATLQSNSTSKAKLQNDSRAKLQNGSTNKAKLQNIQDEISKNSRFLKGLYESLVEGDITADDYKELKSGYETKIANLAVKEKELQERVRHEAVHAAVIKSEAKYLDALGSVSDLTADVLGKLVAKILVYQDGRIEVVLKSVDHAKDHETPIYPANLSTGGDGNE